ncbi:Oligoendopeptidase F, plasmid [Alphaproteobacteria bacterium SO-S41]|nr:Oligoendopeptidase F, plasmid [Alphaproteobacteria bacterium SO-S41]
MAKTEISAPAPAWDLRDLYAGLDDPRLTADLKRALDLAKAFSASFKGRISALAAGEGAGVRLAAMIADYEALGDLSGRIAAFAGLAFSAHSSDPAVGKFYGDMQDRLSEIGSETLFLELELSQIPDADLEAALATAPGLARYRPWLESVRAFRPHQLAEDVERLLYEKDLAGASAWSRLFDETVAGLRYEVRGETLTGPQALNLLGSPDAALRRDAAAALSETFAGNARTFAFILNTLSKDKEIDDRWRAYPEATSFRHLMNQVEPEVVEALRRSVVAAFPQLSHRYYKLKARWLGVEKLNDWDRNAPLPQASDARIGWDAAKATVLGAYGRFAPRMAELATPFFEKSWIDAEPRPGKSGGAFSHGTVPSAHPYILMNYLGKPRDVMTLAHELGHGVHQTLAAKQGVLLAATPLTLAETASVFGEMLTFRALLDAAPSPRERAILLAGKVEDMLNTVVRQIAFYEFELRFHAKRRQGELTPEDIGAIWMAVQQESLGPAFDFAPGYANWWCYIPHFVRSPFYVYAYAFGDCLVNSLYALYEDAHPEFVPKYFAMLEAGGSKRHTELLKPFGLNASDPQFWTRGLGMISGFIDELERDAALLDG